MLHSMTGFGEAQYEAEGISFQVEIKTLNNRFLKTTVKLPDALAFAEPEVERIIRNMLNRGSVTYIVHMRHLEDAGPFEVNPLAVKGYMKQLEQFLDLHDNGAVHIDLAAILQLPGVCQLRPYSEDEHKFLLDNVKKLTHQALEQLCQMRAEEGESIVADLKKNCRVIQNNLDDLLKFTDKVLQQYHQRIQQRVNGMLADASLKIDEDMLAKEVAMFAERSDINEEISRLRSHLDQFNEICNSDELAGRKLDFLTQEMLREANTIASKAGDARISQHVVEIKVAIDRLKEQVQNVE